MHNTPETLNESKTKLEIGFNYLCFKLSCYEALLCNPLFYAPARLGGGGWEVMAQTHPVLIELINTLFNTHPPLYVRRHLHTDMCIDISRV